MGLATDYCAGSTAIDYYGLSLGGCGMGLATDYCVGSTAIDYYGLSLGGCGGSSY